MPCPETGRLVEGEAPGARAAGEVGSLGRLPRLARRRQLETARPRHAMPCGQWVPPKGHGGARVGG